MLMTWQNTFKRARGGAGLSGYWEEYQYMDGIDAGTPSGSSDAGTSWASGLLSSITSLGTTWIQADAAKDAAKAAVQSRPASGQTTVVSPSGQVMTTQAAPLVTTSSALDFLKNPLVLAGLGVGAFMLLRRKK